MCQGALWGWGAGDAISERGVKGQLSIPKDLEDLFLLKLGVLPFVYGALD